MIQVVKVVKVFQVIHMVRLVEGDLSGPSDSDDPGGQGRQDDQPRRYAFRKCK